VIAVGWGVERRCAGCETFLEPRRYWTIDSESGRPLCRNCLRWKAHEFGDNFHNPLSFDDMLIEVERLEDAIAERGDPEMADCLREVEVAWLASIADHPLPKHLRPKP
jgi:hypothetical protein